MAKKKLDSTLEFHSVLALPYNPYFKKDVGRIRKKYGIPKDTHEAQHMFSEELNQARERFYRDLHRKKAIGMVEDPFAFADIFGLFPKLRTPTNESFETDVIDLLQRFRLPLILYNTVLEYVVTLRKSCISCGWIKPYVNLEFDEHRGYPEYEVTIWGITQWTTKKQWGEIWDNEIQPDLKEYRVSKKLGNPVTVSKQMKCWSEWHHMFKVKRLTLEEIADRWDKMDAEHDNVGIDTSTISKAITEFERIVKPTNTRD